MCSPIIHHLLRLPIHSLQGLLWNLFESGCPSPFRARHICWIILNSDTSCWGCIPQTLSYESNKPNINTKYQWKEINKMTMSGETQEFLRGLANPMPTSTPKDKHFHYEKKYNTRISLCSYTQSPLYNLSHNSICHSHFLSNCHTPRPLILFITKGPPLRIFIPYSNIFPIF